MDFPFQIRRVPTPYGHNDLVCVSPLATVPSIKPPGGSIIGWVPPSLALNVENFIPNSAFVEMLHNTIAQHLPEIEPLKAQAAKEMHPTLRPKGDGKSEHT